MRIAVIGLGNMGRALASALAGAGRPVVGWNRTPHDYGALAAAGVAPEADLAGAVRQADLLLLVSLSYDTTRETLQPVAQQLAGKTLLLFCSGLPQDAEAFAAWANKQGARSADVAVMGYPSDVGSERALFLHAGDPALFAELQPVLAPLGPRHRHVGAAAGAAKTFDNVLLARNYAWMLSYLQAAALARASGIDTTLFTDVSMDLLGPLFRNIERAKGEIAAGSFAPATQAALTVHHKALSVVLAMAADSGARTPILNEAHAAMQRAIAAGYGDREIAACFTSFLPSA
jgi:3-hydroxyisobutyrate dehydrogenase-like beta-hydroxyacid dehydrogenase